MKMKKEYFEYRGVDNLVFAEVITDTAENFVTGPVMPLAPIAKIKRSTENSSSPSYYDNQPLLVVSSVGADELGLTVAPLDLETYAKITGQAFDSMLGALIEGPRANKYFAIGYRTKGTDGKHRYVWRYKGQFSIPDEENNTENDSTDTTNTELTWKGVSTVHKFTKTKDSARSIVIDERYGGINFETFFDIVQTPDTLRGYAINTTRAPEIFPAESVFAGTIVVTIANSMPGVTTYYTTDGTEPKAGNETTIEYTEPFSISETKTIKAYSSRNNVQDSMNITRKFIKEG